MDIYMKFLGVDFDYYFENYPNKDGFFGKYGGNMGDIKKEVSDELSSSYKEMLESKEFLADFERMKRWRMGMPTPLVLISKLSNENVKIYGKLKRKNNFGVTPCLGQALLAKFTGKERIIASAEDGVAAVMASPISRIPCEVYVNPEISGKMFVLKLKVMGGTVIETDGDPKEEVLKAVNEDPEGTFLYLGSANSSHPYPTIIRDFSKNTGDETLKQYRELEGKDALPTAVITSVGNGDGSVGFINGFTNIFTDIVAINPETEIPELMFLNDLERIRFAEVSEEDALKAKALIEGDEEIKTDLNGAYALAYAIKYAEKLEKGNIIVNL